MTLTLNSLGCLVPGFCAPKQCGGILHWHRGRQTKLQHHFPSLNEYRNLDKIKLKTHKPCNPLASNLLSVQRASSKSVPFSWSCQVPCFVTDPLWCSWTWRLWLPATLLPLLPFDPYQALLRTFSEVVCVYVACGCIRCNKEDRWEQGPECICWTLAWMRSLLSLAFSAVAMLQLLRPRSSSV